MSRQDVKLEKALTALRRIGDYQTPAQLRRECERRYGLTYEEALEYAYENMRNEAMAVRSLWRVKKLKPARPPVDEGLCTACSTQPCAEHAPKVTP